MSRKEKTIANPSGKKKKRILWAKDHASFDWSNIVFSDESRFNLVSDRPVLIRRRKGEEFKPECLVPQLKHCGKGVMVWGY